MNPLTALDITLLRARQQLHIYHIIKKIREAINIINSSGDDDDDEVVIEKYQLGHYVS